MRVKEIFRSIQGEGSMVGTDCTFVRTVGCNLSCAFCDTDFSGRGFELSDDQKFDTEWIWLTGGEPLLQKDVREWVHKWWGEGHKVAVETNGTISLPCQFDHISVSPKVKDCVIKACDDLKVVTPTYDPKDFTHIRAVNRFVQPEFGTPLPSHIPMGWKISIQHHKLWGVR